MELVLSGMSGRLHFWPKGEYSDTIATSGASDAETLG